MKRLTTAVAAVGVAGVLTIALPSSARATSGTSPHVNAQTGQSLGPANATGGMCVQWSPGRAAKTLPVPALPPGAPCRVPSPRTQPGPS
jgi:hypothetical protein